MLFVDHEKQRGKKQRKETTADRLREAEQKAAERQKLQETAEGQVGLTKSSPMRLASLGTCHQALLVIASSAVSLC